ncbi:MAG: acyl-CoA dehydratase activase-related protein [Eubacteriales bacterium]
MPVKVFHGHVLSLKDKADYIFIPRYKTTGKLEFTCPKLCALPDMVRLNLKNDIKILDILINERDGIKTTAESLKDMSLTLNIEYKKVLSAYYKTIKHRLNCNMEISQIEPDFKTNKNNPAIAVLGHSYMIYDNLISMKLIKKLIYKKYNVLTPNNLENEEKRNNAYPYKGRYFYREGFDILGSAYTFADDPNIKGIIYLTPFACGIDSLVTEFIEIRLKSNYSIPWMKLTVDEHTGEAGFDTRLEAFLDMIGCSQ